jgi:predicted  nucleic acid-binding Zn-ribbon protein
MLPDLERLITLQRLDSTAQDAQRRLAEEPERGRALDGRIAAARLKVNAAKEQLAENQSARRASEKDVAVHQGRLSKFREQLMAVKTNVEYQAMQKEIEFAQREIKGLEDRVLERMLEADDLTAALKRAELELASEETLVDAERRAISAELAELKQSLERVAGARGELVTAIDAKLLTLFELVSKRRNGVAVAEARDGICTICHVRLRPQVFNTIRRNEEIVQCDSCSRILFFMPVTTKPAETAIQPAT